MQDTVPQEVTDENFLGTSSADDGAGASEQD